MFDRMPKNVEALKRLWAVLEGLNPGDVLEHGRAERALGVARPDHRYYALIDRIKRRMEKERFISLIVAPMVGYELAKPKEQLELARFRMVQAGRRDRKGHGHVLALSMRQQEMTFTDQRAAHAIEEKFIQRERAARQDAVWAAFLMRPRDNRPPRIAGGEGA